MQWGTLAIINLYGVVMILMGHLHAGGQSNLGHLSLVHRYEVPPMILVLVTLPRVHKYEPILLKFYM